MTVRLYRSDPYLRHFAARVIDRLSHQGRPALLLDRTAFYPTSGGQAHDLGAIGGAAVLDVVERDDGEIVHVLDRPVGEEAVEGEIDWPRRFDHMQQHTGQHILSQAFVRLAGLDTLAVHFGADDCTLDLPAPRIEAGLIERVEDAANQVIYEDRPVVAREWAEADAAAMDLRRPPKVAGLIRVVEVQGYDWSACGGTHVSTTGQVGLIRLSRAERRAEETRVTFLCGRRAMRDYRRVSAVADALAESFRVSRWELDQAVERLREEARAARKGLLDAQRDLVEYEARELLAGAVSAGAARLAVRVYADRDAGHLKAVAKRMASEPGLIALLGSAGARSALCFARAKDAPGDMNALLREALAALGGGAKGGGSADFAQGGGIPADDAQVRAALARAREPFEQAD